MNQPSPPLRPPQAPLDPYAPPPPPSSGGGKVLVGCGMGCLLLLILGIVAGYFLYGFAKKQLAELASSYVSDAPVAIPEPQVSEAEASEVVARFDSFRSAMRTGAATEPLAVTGEEINALLFHHPEFEALAGKSMVRIEDDQLRATVSIDLDELEIPFEFLAEVARGKHFNGEVAFTLDTVAGRPVLHIEDLSVGGRSLPGPVLDELKRENLLKDAASDPDVREFFEKVRSIRVEGDRLVIVPAGAP